MQSNRRRSFTFLELVIAVTVTMLVAVALFAYSQGVTATWSQLVRERNRFTELLNLDRVVDSALSNLVPFTWHDAEGTEFPFIVAEPNGMRFAYRHEVHDATSGGLRFAEFVLENEQLHLVYSDRPFFNWEDVGERRWSVLLAEGVSQISFMYADWSDDTDANWGDRILWLDYWETANSERMDAPLAVMMTITWTDGRSESWFRRTTGNSYRERFGKWQPLSNDKR